ncbi:hypothetical protein JCM3774_003148 [Rhodotorula dairenensis]
MTLMSVLHTAPGSSLAARLHCYCPEASVERLSALLAANAELCPVLEALEQKQRSERDEALDAHRRERAKVENLRTALSSLTARLGELTDRLAVAEADLAEHRSVSARVAEEQAQSTLAARALATVWDTRWREERRAREAAEASVRVLLAPGSQVQGVLLNGGDATASAAATTVRAVAPRPIRARQDSIRMRDPPGPPAHPHALVAHLRAENLVMRQSCAEQLDAKESQIVRLEADVAIRRDELHRLCGTLDILLSTAAPAGMPVDTGELGAGDDQVNRLRARIFELESERQRLSDLLATAERDCAMLRSQLDERDRTFDSLSQRVHDKLLDQRNKLRAAHAETERLRHDLVDREAECRRLEAWIRARERGSGSTTAEPIQAVGSRPSGDLVPPLFAVLAKGFAMETPTASTSALEQKERKTFARPRVNRSASSATWKRSRPVFHSHKSVQLPGRRRSHSLHDSTYPFSASRALQYGSDVLQSLDLPASLLSLREYLVGKLEAAERTLDALKATVEESEAEEAGLSSAAEDDHEPEDDRDSGSEGAPSDGEEEDDDGLMRDSILSDVSAATPEEREEILEEITSLQAFIASATKFLSAMRDELPTLVSSARADQEPSSSPFIHFTLSPDAQATLDRFLDDHPLPSLPNLGLRSRAASSASAVLARASTDLANIRETLAQITSNTMPTAYLPSLPALPSSRSIPDLRTYFSEESTRLSAALSHFKDEASDTLSAGLHRMQDGAAELSAYVKDQGLAVADEAMRMYHSALEIGRERLLRYEELPEEWRNNPHILHGYRYIPIEQYGALFKSMFQWHNETVNIQSHFIGFLSLAALLIYYLVFSPGSPHPLVDPHPGDTAIAVLFVVSAMHCLLCSTAWHLFSGCATTGWFRGAACIDYVGISGLIAASVAGATYYGFYDHPQLASAYMAFNFIIGGIGMLVPWQNWFNQREYKMWRIAFFVSLAASAIAPIAHRSFLIGTADTLRFYSPALPSVIAYLAGLLFYANQFPECCSPGSWHIGASHQLWHVAIVAAVWLHWKAMSDWSTTVALARLAGLNVEEALGGSLAP